MKTLRIAVCSIVWILVWDSSSFADTEIQLVDASPQAEFAVKELRTAVEGRQTRVGLDQAVLGGRVGVVRTEVLAAHHPHPSLVAADELTKGLPIAVAGANHEPAVVLRMSFLSRHASYSRHMVMTIHNVSR